jgi:undecaprenyl-diphosphatase
VAAKREKALPPARSGEDAFVNRLIGPGSHDGKNWFGKAGNVIQRPPSWAAVAGVLAATGDSGRRAAARGAVCYLSAAAVHLPIKAVVGRRHPPGASDLQRGPFTSSFPSGHAAADLAFVFGAAQEMPRAFVPLSFCSLAVHWSLIRKRAHYPSDVLAGGALGIAVSVAVWKLRPPSSGDRPSGDRPSPGGDVEGVGVLTSSNGSGPQLAAVGDGGRGTPPTGTR